LTDKASGEQQPHEPNVGGFLSGAQRPKLEARANYHPTVIQHFVRAVRRVNWLASAVPVRMLTVIAVAIVGKFMANAGMG
ncbi:hypothetical protein ACCT04_36725, partial [Rhizobium ruizarguesonis]